jgi:hypothetical protein
LLRFLIQAGFTRPCKTALPFYTQLWYNNRKISGYYTDSNALFLAAEAPTEKEGNYTINQERIYGIVVKCGRHREFANQTHDDNVHAKVMVSGIRWLL